MHFNTKRYLPELFVLLLILLFIFLKLPALHLPYFWDELGVYARAGLYMHDNGIGLQPADLPPELSRGHPLLFSCIQGIGFHIFGENVTGGHVTALLISVILLWSVYYISKKHYSSYTALLAVMLIIVQPLFFAQSVLVLPEILLTLFLLWSVHFWVEKKYILHGIFAMLAILTKETAIIIPLVIILSELLAFVAHKRKNNLGKFQFRQLFVLLPVMVYIIFLIIQKHQNGWYLFPLHGDNIKLSLSRILLFSKDYLSFLLLEQGRIILTVILIFALLYIRFTGKMVWNTFSVFLIILICGGISFNSLNFYMNRYLLFVLIVFIMLFSAVFMEAVKRFKPWILSIPVIFLAGVYCLKGRELFPSSQNNKNMQEKFNYDENMSYVDYLHLQNQTLNTVLNEMHSTQTILCNFPGGTALLDPRFGFTDKILGKDFRMINVVAGKNVDFAVISDPGSYDLHMDFPDSIYTAEIQSNDVLKMTIYRFKN